MMAEQATAETKSETMTLQEDEELRFAAGGDVVVELLAGIAEVFGAELVLSKRYTFPAGSRVGIYTWQGCKVELIGDTEGQYVAKHTPMVIYLNTHAAMEQMRETSARDNSRGPRLMITGPMDVGKSTVCRILLNYAARLGRCPIFVDLDVGQGQISVPGNIGAIWVERPGDPVEGFSRRTPLVFHFGHLSPADNIPLYNTVVGRMADMVNCKISQNPSANSGGVIINTCGWVNGEGYGCLLAAAEALEIDVVVVIDHERLYNELQRDLPAFVKIVHQPKSGGVEKKSRQQRIAARTAKIREYFYGTKKTPLFPHSFEIKWSDVQIYKVGAPVLPDSCMPLGMKPEDTRTRLVQVNPSAELNNHVLAVSMAEPNAGANTLTTNVCGFIVVTAVNVDRSSMFVLSPQPYPLPKTVLLLSDVTFLDS